MTEEQRKSPANRTMRQIFELSLGFVYIWSLCLTGSVRSIENAQLPERNLEAPHVELLPSLTASNHSTNATKTKVKMGQAAPLSRVYFDEVWKLQSHPSVTIPVPRASYPTFGMVWPLPKLWSSTQHFYPVDASQLKVRLHGVTNYILEAAVQRFADLLRTRTGLSFYTSQWLHQRAILRQLARAYLAERGDPSRVAGTAGTDPLSSTQPTVLWPVKVVDEFQKRFNSYSRPNDAKKAGTLRDVVLLVRTSGASWPSLSMDESYTLSITPQGILVYANETWGALHALTSLTQLFWTVQGTSQVYVNQTYIDDAPRFPHRGIMIDTARHYISKQILLVNLETMAFNKMNVFHWHMVDDQAYPYQSDAFPNLSKKGAYSSKQVYTILDIVEVVEFARLRGIRVVPEFDIPGHTLSLSFGLPDVLSQCLSNAGDSTLYYGPLNPLKNATYEFLHRLLTEVLGVFPDEFVHLGGDEVETGCWSADPDMFEAVKKFKFSDNRAIYEYFWRSIQNLVTNLGNTDPKNRRRMIVWEDALEHVTDLQQSILVHVWKSDLTRAIQQGYNVIYSTCWYLDHLWDVRKWPNYYLCDPAITSSGVPILPMQQQKIFGGEACMWTEYQSDDTILQKIWPVTSAIAERLWSPVFVNNMNTVGPRIEEQRCRLVDRGVPVGVLLGPGTCQSAGVLSAFVKPDGHSSSSSRLDDPEDESPVESPESVWSDQHLLSASRSDTPCFVLYFVCGMLTGIALACLTFSRIGASGALGTLSMGRIKFVSIRTSVPIFFLILVGFYGLSQLCAS